MDVAGCRGCGERGRWASRGDWGPSLAGTDEETILALLTSRSNAQRQEIVAAFKTLFGRVRLASPRAHCGRAESQKELEV